MPSISLLTNRREAQRTVAQNLNIAFGSNAARGDSNTRVLANMIAEELYALNNETRSFVESLSYQNAIGEDLDSIGFEYYGLQRNAGVRAKTNPGDTNFRFFVREGTFGEINGGNSIIIPSGTKISNYPNITTGSEIVYQTKREYILPASSSFTYCEVEAVEVGDSYNVGREVLLHHNFTGYANAARNSLVCKNVYPIINGTNTETDESFRYRIANYISSQRNLNEESMRISGLEIPGVIQVKTIPGYYGLGTTGVVVFGPEKETSIDSLNIIQRRIRSSLGEESRVIAVEGFYTKLDIDLVLIKTPSLTFEEEESIRQELKIELMQLIRTSFESNQLDLNFINAKLNKYLVSNKIVRAEENTNYRHKFKEVILSKSDTLIEREEEKISWIGSLITVSEEERIKLSSFNISFIEDPTNV